jgi:hypothetical protein
MSTVPLFFQQISRAQGHVDRIRRAGGGGGNTHRHHRRSAACAEAHEDADGAGPALLPLQSAAPRGRRPAGPAGGRGQVRAARAEALVRQSPGGQRRRDRGQLRRAAPSIPAVQCPVPQGGGPQVHCRPNGALVRISCVYVQSWGRAKKFCGFVGLPVYIFYV